MANIFYILKKIFIRLLSLINNYANKAWISHDGQVSFGYKARVFNISRNKKKIYIGKNTFINGELTVYKHGGEIAIGEYCFVGEHTKIWSAKKILIGNRVLIAHNVDIHDCNDHPTNALLRHEHFKQVLSVGHVDNIDLNEQEIVIEDDAWIGFGAIILKGVTIGKGAVVGAGSVVTKNVPPYTIVVGNPAKVIKSIAN